MAKIFLLADKLRRDLRKKARTIGPGATHLYTDYQLRLMAGELPQKPVVRGHDIRRKI